jgi:hypothetical protein
MLNLKTTTRLELIPKKKLQQTYHIHENISLNNLGAQWPKTWSFQSWIHE